MAANNNKQTLAVYERLSQTLAAHSLFNHNNIGNVISNVSGNKNSLARLLSYVHHFNSITSLKLEPLKHSKIVVKSEVGQDFATTTAQALKVFDIKEEKADENASGLEKDEQASGEHLGKEIFKSLLAKSQIIPLKHYMAVLSSLEDGLLGKESQPVDLFSINNMSELLMASLPLAVFYKLFTKTSTNCFKFIDLIVQKLAEDTANQEPVNSFTSKNFLNYNWLDQYLSNAVFFFDTNASSQLIKPINLTLKFYDDKVRNLNELSEFLWTNFGKLSRAGQNLTLIEQTSIDYLESFITKIKSSHFDNNNDLFMSYLVKKGFNGDLLKLLSKYKSDCLLNGGDEAVAFLGRKIDLIIYGCMLVYLYSPIDPLDPLEYEQLIEKNKLEQTAIASHEAHLTELNRYRLKEYTEEYSFDVDWTGMFTERVKKADYFLIKNEFEMNLKKFCGLDQLRRFISLFGVNGSGSTVRPIDEEECKIWLVSLENFVQKLMSTFFSFTDVIYIPISGVSLLGYSVNSLFTDWRSRTDEQNSRTASSLVKVLTEYPCSKSHLSTAWEVTDLAWSITRGNTGIDSTSRRLVDELNFISLLHLVSSSLSKFNAAVVSSEVCVEEKRNELLIRLCEYFVARYKAYKEMLAEKENVETFKYKTFGQSEIEDELVQAELEKEFPTFTHVFEDFIEVNTLESNPVTVQADQVIFMFFYSF
jgi:hypothetical protein